MIDINKKYRTRDGRDVVIYAINGSGRYPVYGAVDGLITNWSVDGVAPEGMSHADLFEISPYDDFKIDDPVMVRNYEGQVWVRGYFAGVRDDRASTFADGCTKWSGDGDSTEWNQCRRPTTEELNNES